MLQIAMGRPGSKTRNNECRNKMSTAISDYDRNKDILIKWIQKLKSKHTTWQHTTNITGNHFIYNIKLHRKVAREQIHPKIAEHRTQL
jgi:hypothetical protein